MQNNKYTNNIILSIMISSLLLFAGCGAGGGSPSTSGSDSSSSGGDGGSSSSDGGGGGSSTPDDTTQTGYFIDSAVKGLNYSTNSGASGITDVNGAFKYNSTDTDITFKIGSITLANFDLLNIPTDKKILPTDLAGVGRNNTNNATVLKILRFVQSLDSDNTPSNGIDINSTTSSSLTSTINITDTNVTISMLINILRPIGISLISETQAISHYEATLRNSFGYGINTIDMLVNIGNLKTGQIKSYDEDGNETTNDTIKDDGYYQKGTSRNFTRGADMVTDHITGLMWQDDNDAKTIEKPWVTQANYDAGNYDDTSGDTATTYCEDLTLGGYTNWRLPTIMELKSIVDYEKYEPAISGFDNITSSYYWSSTTLASSTDSAWLIRFNTGNTDYYYKYISDYVRCVRGGQ